jgi:phosphoserine phosphatase
MAGELDYAASLRERIALLEGLSLDAMREAFESVALRPGAAELIQRLRSAGVPVYIVTGGFVRGVTAALDRADVAVDGVIGNRLCDDGQALTGEVRGPHVTGTKDHTLRVLASLNDCPLGETVAVGDGANDIPMLEAAGVAVGVRPKDAVEPVCDRSVDSMSALGDVLEAYIEA